jgi:hypothetical protein
MVRCVTFPPPLGDQPRGGYTGPIPAGYNPYFPGAGAPITHTNGTTILVLGILSLAFCGLIGPVAWVMGNTAIKEMDARPELNFTNRGNVVAGRICGMIATGILVLGILGFIVVIGAGIAAF